MMKRFLPLLLLICPLAFSVSSCNKGKNADADEEGVKDTLRFEVKTDSVGLVDGDFSYAFVVEYPTDAETKNVAAARSIVLKYVDGKFRKGNDSLRNMMEETAKTELAEYKADEFCLGYEHNISIKVARKAKKYVTYSVQTYFYSGGAHGSYSETEYSIDLTRGAVLGWDDYFTAEAKGELKEMLRKAVKEQYYIAKDVVPGFESGWGEFSLPESNPALLEGGVSFVWQPYEIDCYAAGMPQCVIPYEWIYDKLRPEVQALVPAPEKD